jgi:hypothetical protein
MTPVEVIGAPENATAKNTRRAFGGARMENGASCSGLKCQPIRNSVSALI